jgi:AraC family transcriptional regulator
MTNRVVHIKNMVCPRCIRVVREELDKLGHDVRSVVLGEAVISGSTEESALQGIREALEHSGFELIQDKRVRIIEAIKHAVLKLVYNDYEQNPISEKDSVYIARETGYDYHYLTTLFSSVENVTIEQYIILQKIEYVKELLRYGELTLSEIAYRMGYSSVSHVSNQFRKVTGMSPTQFKSLGVAHRHYIDDVKPEC